MRRAIKAALAAGGVLLAGLVSPVLAQDAAQDMAEPRPVLALMGTVPIYWGEAEGLTDLLSGAQEGHWARPVLERRFTLEPVSYLSAEALAGHSLLLLAQPRAFSAQENVALDAWVRAGGRLLLFADPMMTGESRFNLGDRRRPQDVALLSPILTHWGLALRFDEEQDDALRAVDLWGAAVPVKLAGQFALLSQESPCRLLAQAVIAQCRLGAGEALIVADAALLDIEGPWPAAEDALGALSALLAGETGEIAGSGVIPALAAREIDGNPGLSGMAPDARSGTGPP
ncbi:Gldg family protein [Alteraurantiacibacter palmitatis]|uniref:Gldg family protein n=1 Tax=Alteraurantiacibacter palmitatis TaxID=2054628 RepID=A0ABV7E7F7_9SPHN